MKHYYGTSKTGNLKEALSGVSNPSGLILMSNASQFEKHVSELEEAFPGVPSIGCIAMGYGREVTEKGVCVVAIWDNISVAANVLEEAGTMPAKYIGRLEKDISTIRPSRENTAMIDFCTGNDAAVLSSIRSLLEKNQIGLMGGTGDGGKLSCCGRVYTDAMVYLLVKNGNGKVKTYKENIYEPRADVRLMASKTDRKKYYVGELNGRSAKQVYMELTGVKEQEVANQTFKNPLGKMVGEDICIISLKEVSGNGLCCFRQINDSDILTILDLRDIREIVDNTLDNIQKDFKKISFVFSVNCVFRYMLFGNERIMGDYLKQMGTLGNQCGFIGFGEHFNGQFINQSMTCVVFE